MGVTPSEYRRARHVYVGPLQETKDVEREFVALEERFRFDVGIHRRHEGHHAEGNSGQGQHEAFEGRKHRRSHAARGFGLAARPGDRRASPGCWRARARVRRARPDRPGRSARACGLREPRRSARSRHRDARRVVVRHSAATRCRSCSSRSVSSFLRKGRSASPFQLVIGWSMMSIAVLGLLQVARGAEQSRRCRRRDRRSRRLDRCARRRPARSAAGHGRRRRAARDLAFAGGALLVTRTSIKTFAQHTGGFLAAVGAPLGRAAKSGISNISTLSSDREADAAARPS